jgi:hypothetical protein
MAKEITETTRLPVRGSTIVEIVPPRPCGLGDCVAEMQVDMQSTRVRVHLDDDQRNQLIEALGGRVGRPEPCGSCGVPIAGVRAADITGWASECPCGQSHYVSGPEAMWSA